MTLVITTESKMNSNVELPGKPSPERETSFLVM